MIENPVSTGQITLQEVAIEAMKLLARETDYKFPAPDTMIGIGESERPGYAYMVLLPQVSGLTQWSFRLRDANGSGETICVFFDILPSSYGASAAFIRFVDEETYENDRRGTYIDQLFLSQVVAEFEKFREEKNKQAKHTPSRQLDGSRFANRAARRNAQRKFQAKGGYRA